MTIERVCKFCGSAILAAHAGRKYCSQECYTAVKKRSHERALELRYAAPRSLASVRFTVGQTVRVPTSEVRTIGGKPVTVTGSAIGTVRKIDAGRVLVSIRRKRSCWVDEQTLRDAQKLRELPVAFGNGVAVGSDAS